MLKAGIIGASGYAGGELIRLLANHPGIEITAITSRTHEGKQLGEVFSSFTGWKGPVFGGSDTADAVQDCDVVFMAVPHGVAMRLAPDLLRMGKKVIDFGSDFRFRDPKVYEKWYKQEHLEPELAKGAVYGLPEFYRDEIRTAQLVGNPGCYPTSIALALEPILKAGLVDTSRIIIDSKSGVSGAGRKADLPNLFTELSGNFKAYGLAGHRHVPEIEQELSRIAGKDLKVCFTPHLLPIPRGILSTIHLGLTREITTAEVEEMLLARYASEPFVKILREPVLPEIRGVAGTNTCHIGVRVDARTQSLIVVSVIDNLIKGAAGQALQNMNLMCGFEETTALLSWPVFP